MHAAPRLLSLPFSSPPSLTRLSAGWLAGCAWQWRGIEDEVVPFCIANNIGILPWSPMGQGLLTGKVTHADQVQPGRQRSRLFSNKRPQQRHGEPGLEEETFASIRKMSWIADQISQPLANVALAWAREQRGVTSLLMGARTADQLTRNLGSVKLELVRQPLELE